jgi:hypothetical protein
MQSFILMLEGQKIPSFPDCLVVVTKIPVLFCCCSHPVHRYGLELCNFSKGCIIPFILVR